MDESKLRLMRDWKATAFSAVVGYVRDVHAMRSNRTKERSSLVGKLYSAHPVSMWLTTPPGRINAALNDTDATCCAFNVRLSAFITATLFNTDFFQREGVQVNIIVSAVMFCFVC
jgi:hypothetical protein